MDTKNLVEIRNKLVELPFLEKRYQSLISTICEVERNVQKLSLQ